MFKPKAKVIFVASYTYVVLSFMSKYLRYDSVEEPVYYVRTPLDQQLLIVLIIKASLLSRSSIKHLETINKCVGNVSILIFCYPN